MKKGLIYILIGLLLSVAIFPPNKSVAQEQATIKDEIIYDILIDRFNNGRQAPSEQRDIHNPLTYNGGDIQGITYQLDKIVELGFTAISLSPVMENAEAGYHGYWIEDFYEVEEEFGTLEDLQQLIEKAHEKGLKVFLEFVPNYVAKSSPLVSDPDKVDWFKENEIEPIEATKWLDEVLLFDQENSEVVDYLTDVALYWIDQLNIDGYKLHAADQASPAFLEQLASAIKAEHDNFYIFATSLQGDSLNHLCTIEQIDAFADTSLFAKLNEVFSKPDEPVSQLYEEWLQNNECDRKILYVDNKESARFSNNFTEQAGRNAVTTWSLTLAFLYFTPGTPLIYQGSEVPMYGPGFPENQALIDIISADPDLKKVFEKHAAARDEFPALIHGDFELLASEEGFSLFKRTYGDEVIYFGINNDSRSRFVKITDIDSDELQLRGLFQDETVRMSDTGEFVVGLKRESAELYIIQPNVGINWVFIGFVVGVTMLFIIFVAILSAKQRKREKNNA